MMMKRLYLPLYVFGALLTQVLGAIVLALSLLPSYYLIRAAWSHVAAIPNNLWSGILLCLSLGFAFFIFGNTLLFVIVTFRNIFGLVNHEQTGDFRSDPAILSIAIYNFLVSIAIHLYLPFVRNTPPQYLVLSWNGG